MRVIWPLIDFTGERHSHIDRVYIYRSRLKIWRDRFQRELLKQPGKFPWVVKYNPSNPLLFLLIKIFGQHSRSLTMVNIVNRYSIYNPSYYGRNVYTFSYHHGKINLLCSRQIIFADIMK